MFPVGDADASRADVKVAVLVVAALGGGGVEIELDIHCIGGEKIVVVIGVRLDVEVLKSLAPLLGVLAEVDESGKCLVETEELVEYGWMWLALAVQG